MTRSRTGAKATATPTDVAAADPPALGDPTQRCRNCGAAASGRYCPNCGQETTLELPSAGRFLREAAGRYVAFDGRLWRTLQALVFRPGFLTREYLAARRQRYVRPARLFIALSIALFAILSITARPVIHVDTTVEAGNRDVPIEGADIDTDAIGLQVDRDLNLRFDPGTGRLAPLRSRIDAFNRLSRQQKVEQLLFGVLRHGPYAAVALLPVFALLLKIAYAGRAQKHPLRPRRYAAHLVFGAHNHAFVFLVASLMLVIDFAPLRATLVIAMIIYALASMRVVYGGGWPGVMLRAVFVAACYAVFFAIALVGLLLAAVALR